MVNKALFLDRDGTINEDLGFVHRIEDFRFIDGIFDLCRWAEDNGYLIIVITNQSGIERGYYTDDEFLCLTSWMKDQFKDHGITITEVFYCPSLSGRDRKPDIGMFEKACLKYDIDMGASLSLGDKERDIEAGIRAGVGTNILFSSESNETKADKVIKNIKEMAVYCLSKKEIGGTR